MSLHSDSVGRRGDVVSDLVEDRWLSNYAAAVGDENDRYFENRTGAPAVHPTYVSHLEWDSIGALHEVLDLSEAERAQGVHSFNHTDLLAPFTAGDRLDSRAVLVGAEQRRSGLRLTIRIDTHVGDTQVARSYTQTIFRGVDLDGPDVRPEVPESSLEEGRPFERTIEIPFGKLAPYVFSECARDYGAIHTDRRAAEAAGIPGLIIHGTGTFAAVLSAIVNHEAGGDPQRVRGFSGKLSAMIFCPSTTVLHVADTSGEIRFELVNESGETAISQGVVRLG